MEQECQDMVHDVIWYQFKKSRYIPAKITFHRRASLNRAKDETPMKFDFVVSNPSNSKKCSSSSSWKLVCSASYSESSSLNKIRECQVGVTKAMELGNGFRCLGLKIWKLSGNGRAAALQGIELWSWI